MTRTAAFAPAFTGFDFLKSKDGEVGVTGQCAWIVVLLGGRAGGIQGVNRCEYDK